MPTPELQTQMTISQSEDGTFHINGKYRMSYFSPDLNISDKTEQISRKYYQYTCSLFYIVFITVQILIC